MSGNIVTKMSQIILISYRANFGRFFPEFWGNQLYYNAYNFGATNIIKLLGNIVTKRSQIILNSYRANFGRFCPEFWGNQLYYNADDFGATNVIDFVETPKMSVKIHSKPPIYEHSEKTPKMSVKIQPSIYDHFEKTPKKSVKIH